LPRPQGEKLPRLPVHNGFVTGRNPRRPAWWFCTVFRMIMRGKQWAITAPPLAKHHPQLAPRHGVNYTSIEYLHSYSYLLLNDARSYFCVTVVTTRHFCWF